MKPRPQIETLPDVHHGAPDYAELERLGLSPDEIIDFSVNSNPYGPDPAVRQALESVPLDRYPDREALALRRSLSEHHHLSPESILVTNGTAELIWLIALTYLRPDDAVLILEPTFGEYARAAALIGAELHTWRAHPEDEFAFQADEIARHLQANSYRLVFLCNPNNPTGQALSPSIINEWSKNYPETLFIIDEAYIAFAEEMTTAADPQQANLLIMRSMTKDYALAGLRLGYAVAHANVIKALSKARPPWSINALAQAGGIAALESQDYYQECWKKSHQNKEALVSGLEGLGFSPVPSKTHFFLLPVGNGAHFRRTLMKHGIQVRDCASFGLPGYVRIAARRPEENRRLLQAIESTKFTKHTKK
jgi:histidinol-phosphate aminotransferase